MFSLCFKRTIESQAAVGRRLLCSQKLTGAGGEQYIENILRKSLDASKVEVEDISGGCGSMYKIAVESPRFRGLSLVKQHKLVKSAISTEFPPGLLLNDLVGVVGPPCNWHKERLFQLPLRSAAKAGLHICYVRVRAATSEGKEAIEM